MFIPWHGLAIILVIALVIAGGVPVIAPETQDNVIPIAIASFFGGVVGYLVPSYADLPFGYQEIADYTFPLVWTLIGSLWGMLMVLMFLGTSVNKGGGINCR